MGLDLRLLPFDSSITFLQDAKPWGYSHTILSCPRNSVLFDLITKIETKCGKPVPTPFHSFTARRGDGDDPGYGDTQIDPYGDPINWVPVKKLLALGTRLYRLTHGAKAHPKMRAIWTYLAALDPETPIALYWH